MAKVYNVVGFEVRLSKYAGPNLNPNDTHSAVTYLVPNDGP